MGTLSIINAAVFEVCLTAWLMGRCTSPTAASRQAGLAPPPDRARLALGVVVEMPVADGHDLLAAYRDGSARYLNYSGSAWP